MQGLVYSPACPPHMWTGIWLWRATKFEEVSLLSFSLTPGPPMGRSRQEEEEEEETGKRRKRKWEEQHEELEDHRATTTTKPKGNKKKKKRLKNIFMCFPFFLFVAACYMQGSRHRHTKAKKKSKVVQLFSREIVQQNRMEDLRNAPRRWSQRGGI